MEENQAKKKRLFIWVVVTLGILAVVLFIFLRNGSSGGNLQVSDVVMENTQNIDSLSRQDFNFFTGSAVANVNLLKGEAYVSSNATSDMPYSQVFRVDYSEVRSTLLAQVLYSDQDFYTITGLEKPLSGPQQVWITQTGSENPSLFNPFGSTKTILDAKVSSTGFILLVNDGGTQNSLYSYETSPKQIASNISDNQIVAVTAESIVTRDLSGKTTVYGLGGNKISSIDSKNEKILVDKQTGSIVQLVDKKLVIHGNGGQKFSINTKDSGFFVSRGYIVSLDSLVLPQKLTVTNISTRKQKNYSVNFSNKAITELITGVIILSDGAESLGLLTETNSLLIATEDANFFASLQTYQFPEFKNSGLVNYNLGTNEAVIYSTNIGQSLTLAAQDCTCDLNQIHKYWQKSFDSNSYQPTTPEPEEGEEENF